MHKVFITILFFFLAVLATAWDKELLEYYSNDNVDLSVGIEKPDFRFIWDFNNPYHWENWLKVEDCIYIPIKSTDMAYHNLWYTDYFAKKPFDGVIDPPIIGEPLPSPLSTLLLAFGVAGIIYSYRYKSGSVA